MYNNLFVKTEYSYMDSLIKLTSYIDYAKENKLQAIAICDDTLAGAYAFYLACQKASITPIIGLKVDVKSIIVGSTTFLLFAKNDVGYSNLVKLSSYICLYKELDFSELLKYRKGLRVISFDNKEILHDKDKAFKFLNKYHSAFEEYYIGLDYLTNDSEYLYNLAQENHIKTVYARETAYFSINEKEYLQVLNAIKRNRLLAEIDMQKNMQFLSYEEALNLVKHKDILDNTKEFAKTDLHFNTDYKLPVFEKKGINNNFNYLKALCAKGLEKRLNKSLKNIDTYTKRLAYELDVIKKLGFVDYFLIVYDFILHAKRDLHIYVGPGRGSSASSLVSYCLGITNVDPIKYGLMFERFLNKDRISMPDIDVDFPDDKREEVIDYVRKKYGKMHVACIQTFNRFLGKSSLRDVARVMNLNKSELERALTAMPRGMNSVIKAYNTEDISILRQRHDKMDRLYTYAYHIEGLIKNTSTHAAGILITFKELSEYLPICLNNQQQIQTQFEAKYIEKLGLLKMDFLGLRNLTVIDKTVKLIHELEKVKLDINKVPLDDKKTLNILNNGDTLGIFQLESSGMRNLLRMMRVTSFGDLFYALALYRPGPSDNINVFVNYKHHPEKVTYLHPDLEPILKDTFGIILYQEQIINILAKFGGYSYSEADVVRRAISKKDEKTLLETRKKFIAGGLKKHYQKAVLESLFDYIIKFANYGFNKAHSVAYSLITYQTAYLKANYPREYMTILMSYLPKDHSLEEYKRECMNLGIKLHNPDINLSTNVFEYVDGYLLMPLSNIKYVSNNMVDSIIKEREHGKFTSYADFTRRTRGQINERCFRYLVYAGSLDSFKLKKKVMIDNYQQANKIFEYEETLDIKGFDIVGSEEYSSDILESYEKEALGVNIKYNFMRKYDRIIAELKLNKLIDLRSYNSIDVIARVNRIKKIKTKNGNDMAFITIEDDTSICEIVCFPNVYKLYGDMLLEKECFGFNLLTQKNASRESIQAIKIRGIKLK